MFFLYKAHVLNSSKNFTALYTYKYILDYKERKFMQGKKPHSSINLKFLDCSKIHFVNAFQRFIKIIFASAKYFF
jgi:hypothetical protein